MQQKAAKKINPEHLERMKKIFDDEDD